MMQCRRTLLKACAATVLAPLGSLVYAQQLIPVDVVKVMSFSCSFCYAAESHDRMILVAAGKSGGRFVRAPIPVEEGASGWRERTYYAARDLDPKLGEAVKESIYRGIQESEVTLNDLTQLYYWFVQDIPAFENRFNALFEKAQAPSSNDALLRAIRLVKNSGVSQLPTYILLSAGAVQATLDSSNSRGTSLPALRDDVIAQIDKISNQKS